MNPADRWTEGKLVLGGISSGMRVLDVGCGPGNVTMLLANLVGPSGKVVGLDIDARMIRMAQERTQKEQCTNVEFLCTDILGVAMPEVHFDAIVGRRVLMYLPNVVDALRRLYDLTKPGGICIFQEHDSHAVETMTELPLREKVRQSIWKTVAREGGDVSIGSRLCDHFQKAGFEVVNIEALGNVEAPTSSYPYASLLRMMRPRMLEKHVIQDNDFDWDKLEMQLEAERKNTPRTYINEMAYWIFARKAEVARA